VLRGGPAGGLDHAAHPFDEDRHLVADLTDIAGRHRQRRQMRAVADPHQQQVAVLHLDHRLQHLAALEQLRRTEYVDATFMAVFRHTLGQREKAFDELARAGTENSVWLFPLDVDPRMDPFRDDPRFDRVAAVAASTIAATVTAPRQSLVAY